MSSQGWKHGVSGHTHSGDDSSDNHHDIRNFLIEETFHWVHHWAWSKVYTPFSLTWDSALGRCTGGAQCDWWMHWENSGCSNLNGEKCSNWAVTCTGDCASFNESGRCMEIDGNCAQPSCDLAEFFLRVYLVYINETLVFWPETLDPQTLYSDISATVDIEQKLTSTPACSDLYAAMQNPDYALPKRVHTGIYTTTATTTTEEEREYVYTGIYTTATTTTEGEDVSSSSTATTTTEGEDASNSRSMKISWLLLAPHHGGRCHEVRIWPTRSGSRVRARSVLRLLLLAARSKGRRGARQDRSVLGLLVLPGEEQRLARSSKFSF